MFRKIIPVLVFILLVGVYFWQFFVKGLLPIPADTIIGLYHPYRDSISKEYPNGYPFKNFLITDPVRQQIPWKTFTITQWENKSIPSWNSYSLAGTPNLANFQSGALYPLNILFIFGNYPIFWTIFIMIQPLLAGIFVYFYLKNLKLDVYSSFFGSVVFAFSGFFAMWLEWGNVVHTALWLPLILLSIDKLSNIKKIKRNSIIWMIVFFVSIVFSAFAGHLQTFFYLIIFSLAYFFARLYQSKERKIFIFLATIPLIIAIVISLVQFIPTFEFIGLSGRNLDQFMVWKNEGWFIPWNHLVQFVVPDYYGNPTTLNYWGVWNYGELTGYVGISALILALFSTLFRRDKKTFFFIATFFISLFFALPSIFSTKPFELSLPFISTSQPTRLLFITDFSLSILAALGLNYLLIKGKLKQVLVPIVIIGFVFIALFLFTKFGGVDETMANLQIANRNILFPGLIFTVSSLLILLIPLISKRFKNIILILLILICIIDLFRFSWKFNTFTDSSFLYPQTKSISFLKNNLNEYRYGTTDSRIMAPNFNLMHGLNSVEGYDPLYLLRYGEFVSAINRNRPDIKPPFGFNRIIRVENYDSNLIDLLGVKYLLSLNEINNPKYNLVFEEGQTKIYENRSVLPRAFFVTEIKSVENKEDVIKEMFEASFEPSSTAILEEELTLKPTLGTANIVEYKPNRVVIETDNQGVGFLVLTDSFYPSWRVKINNVESKIYRVDYIFRGVIVPKGKNTIVFENKII